MIKLVKMSMILSQHLQVCFLLFSSVSVLMVWVRETTLAVMRFSLSIR